MKKYFLLFVIITINIFPQKMFLSDPIVRVRILESIDSIEIQPLDNWKFIFNDKETELSPNNGEIVIFVKDGLLNFIDKNGNESSASDSLILKNENNTSTIKIKNVPFGVGWWWESKEDRIYEGDLCIYLTKKNKLEVINKLELEQYLKGVVPYEIGNNSPLEALKAQAVAARSEAIMALRSKNHGGIHHDLTSDVECQVFSGNIKRTQATDIAVDETRSIVLSELGNPINAYYASNCGGHSELIANVWKNRETPETYKSSNFDCADSVDVDLQNENNLRNWILSIPNSFCNPNNDIPDWSKNNFRWKREFLFDDISNMTSKGNDFGKLNDINILKRGTSGRIYKAIFSFENKDVEVNGELNIRQMFTPPLKSSCFVYDKTDSSFVIYGAGWGHGVGMCQSGAISMAKQGYNFTEILNHYYRKADLLKIY